MEPILTKDEIADLLAAIRSGKVSADFVGNGLHQSKQFLHSTEIDLFQTFKRATGRGEMRIPNFDLVIDNFSRRFATGLTNTLQRNFTVEREEIETTDFQQSILDLNNQGAVGIYSLAPLQYGCLFHFDTRLAFTLLEMMLGSSPSSEALALERNLTTIEIAVLKTSMVEICTELQKAMQSVVVLQPHLTKVENNFRLVNIVEPKTEVLVTAFTIRIAGEPCGQMRFIIPYITLEPLQKKFKELVTFTPAAVTNTWTNRLAREAREMESKVTASSGLITMTIRKLLDLRPGDIIDLQYNPDQPLTIMVEDQPLFLAIPGERNGKKAFHVTGRYSNRLGGIHGST
jgi:flagellar motor switch protein FliM